MKMTAKRVYTIAACALLAATVPAPGARLHAQVAVPGVDDTLDRTLERRMPPAAGRVGERVQDRLDERAAQAAGAVDDPVAGDGVATNGQEAVDGVRESVSGAIDGASSGVTAAVATVASTAGALRTFRADIDPFGRPIEKNVLVVLVAEDSLPAVAAFGLEIVAERELGGLGMTLVTLSGPNAHRLAQTAVELRQAVPGAIVDFNHVYRGSAPDAGGSGAASRPADGAPAAPAADGGLRIGMIDSAVAPGHASLAGRHIEHRDFVTHEGKRPLGHGTAVASLLAGATGEEDGILAASVFFQLPEFAPGATTESLVAALDWLAGERVDVINMSLAGPANALLERALDAIAGSGPTVVAAVGNNGPAGDPLYPAAYAPVIGVTAVDREQRVFRYANRGDHVAFAALGVNVKVADAGGGWRIESGTSMASPRVAAAVAAAHRQGVEGRAALVEVLSAGARDLGVEGFDDVFGHGLIASPPAVVSRVSTRTKN